MRYLQTTDDGETSHEFRDETEADQISLLHLA